MKSDSIRLLFSILFVLTSLCFFEVIANAKGDAKLNLVFGYTEACPHMCPEGKDKGFTTDITRQALETFEYHVNFKALPWARAVSNANSGVINGVISTGKVESPELIYPQMELAT
jgi:hypothetical protein